MLTRILRIGTLALALAPATAPAVDARSIWDNRCEYCHGDPAEFSGKYLWNVGGRLQGQHHIDDLHLFMRRHYLPEYMIEPVNAMLLADANSPLRFDTECGECHGSAAAFVEKSLWIRGDGITGMETGRELDEFLPTHRNLNPEDVEFYLKLLIRVGGAQ